MRIEISDFIYNDRPLEDQVYRAFETYSTKDEQGLKAEDILIKFKDFTPTIRERELVRKEINKFVTEFGIEIDGEVKLKAGNDGDIMILKNSNAPSLQDAELVIV